MSYYLYGFLIVLTLTTSRAQQQYSGNSIVRCTSSDETGPSPAFLYTCNDEVPSCKAFLMFRTQSPYLSLSSISNFTSSDPVELSRINNIASSEILALETEVIVPVTCSCSGKYYQANTSYVSRPTDNTYLTIANNTYEGLTTCDALERENKYGELELYPGLRLSVPLRCACPAQEQIADGTRFLFTYLVTWEDDVPHISERFNVSARSVAMANGFSDENPIIYPFTTILIPLPTEPLVSEMRKSHRKVALRKHKSYRGIYAGVGACAALAVLAFVLVLFFFHYRRKRTNEALSIFENKQRLPENFMDKLVGIGEILKIYTYEELEEATDNFSPQKRVSNSIYRGTLRGKLLAIKKMTIDLPKEIKILSNINHFNLISLYGVCEHDEVFYLVYEYLEEGSLKDWLHKENCPFAHSWNHRILIALDVANGLDYLHNFTDPAYVHKDINSSSILLNRDLRAKIAHFSLARENINSHTTCVVGQKGYMAPEYVETGKVTPKTDVYAFGVVLLALITGREAIFLQDGDEVLLSETVVAAVDGGTGLGDEINVLIDPRLQVKHPLGYIIDHSELALRLMKLSVACLAREPANRLSMAEVVSGLMKIQPDVPISQSFSIE